MISVYILLFAVACIFLYNKRHRSRDVNLIEKIPGPKTSIVPFIGNLHQFYGSPEDMWNISREFSKTYYPTHRVWALGEAEINICHPDDIEIILTSKTHISKGPAYKFFHPWLGTGLLTSTGAKWYKRRQILKTAFQYNILSSFVDVFNYQTKCVIETLKKNPVHDVKTFTSNLALKIICETTMGTRLVDGFHTEEFISAVHNITSLILKRAMSVLAQFDWIFRFLPSGRLHNRVLKIIHDFSENIIEDRKSFRNKSNVDNGEINDSGSTEKNNTCLLDLLLQAREKGEIDDLSLRDEINTFIFGGHDTTSLSTVFTLLLLAEHKTIQDKARAEVNNIFEQSGGKLGMSELQNLKYLERCIKESLRLYPVVFTIGRVTDEDLQLKNYLIPKNIAISVHIFDVHRDPNFWPNPETFDPDRFSPENCQGRHPYCYIPFSAGPRNCIGQKFGMMEMKSTIAHLLYSFHLEPIDTAANIRLQLDLVLRPPCPVRIKFIAIRK